MVRCGLIDLEVEAVAPIDANGRVRAKIHPPDKVASTDHLHIYGSKGRPLDANLRVVSPRAPEAHIPLQPQ
jgi:hypothetical protein